MNTGNVVRRISKSVANELDSVQIVNFNNNEYGGTEHTVSSMQLVKTIGIDG